MEFKSEYYNETQINSFVISYGFKQGLIENKDNLDININFQNYKNNKLVISFNPLDFGKVLTLTILDNGKLYILQNKENLTIKILSSEKSNIIEYFKDGDLMIKFTDIKLSDISFIRIFDNNKQYYFENNQQILFTRKMKTKFI
jgi:alkyl hydroperoxide reductase subunit AhpC